MNADYPDFTGQTVYFVTRGSAVDCGVYLVNPAFQERAGRLFVAGTMPETTNEALFSGCPAAVAWDDVVYYCVVERANDLYKRPHLLGKLLDPEGGEG